jgi:hypothetical protein
MCTAAIVVGATGFEPATSCTPCKRATKLRYAPTPTQWAGARFYQSVSDLLAPLACGAPAEETLGDRRNRRAVIEHRDHRCGDRQLDAES